MSLLIITSFADLIFAANCGGTTTCNCGDTVTFSYNITANLTNCVSELIIRANDIVLDCQGYAIVGSTTFSTIIRIELTGKQNVTIKNSEKLYLII